MLGIQVISTILNITRIENALHSGNVNIETNNKL